MATFGNLQLTSTGPDGADDNDEDDSSDDEEYLPENDTDASLEEEEEEDEAAPASPSDASGDKAVTKASKARRPKAGTVGKGRRQSAAVKFGSRARRGGIRIEGEGESGDAEKTGAGVVNPEASTTAVLRREELPEPELVDVRSKQRADALWASFLSDVGPRPSRDASSSKPAVSMATAEPAGQERSVAPAAAAKAATTRKVFDFAGESVTVEVAAPPAAAASGLPAAGKRPPSAVSGGVRGLLDRLSKRPKLSTLEKSRLDWDTFKSAEGIAEDLAIHNRGKAGYMERQEFLERADYRQFERERDARLASSSGGKKPS